MRRARSARGFSLLEMLVALAILGLSLGALYQATSGATRNVRSAEKYAYGVELARSLVAEHALVPAGGLSVQGETAGGFLWQVEARPAQAGSGSLPPGTVQDLGVVVRWSDGRKAREVVLNSVAAGVPRE